MRFLLLIPIFFLCACATQAQLMDRAEISAWEKTIEIVPEKCGGKSMNIDDYDKSYTPSNVLKREKCERKVMMDIVQPYITTPIAYKELLSDMKVIYRKFSSRKINFEEFDSEIDLAIAVYEQKRQAHLTPIHNIEMQQWNDTAKDFNQSMQRNRPVQTYCNNIGGYTSCTSY